MWNLTHTNLNCTLSDLLANVYSLEARSMDQGASAITIRSFLTFPPILLLPCYWAATILIIFYHSIVCSATVYDGILQQILLYKVFEIHLFFFVCMKNLLLSLLLNIPLSEYAAVSLSGLLMKTWAVDSFRTLWIKLHHRTCFFNNIFVLTLRISCYVFWSFHPSPSYLFLIPHWVKLVMPLYLWVWDHLLQLAGQPTRHHTPKENWLSLG